MSFQKKKMTPEDTKIQKLEEENKKIVRAVAELLRKVSYLERENSRRKVEVSQIVNKLRK